MPNIREYTNEAPVFQPSNAAAGSLSAAAGAVTSAAGRAAKAFDYLGQDVRSAFDATGKAAATAFEQFVVQPEISKGGALFAVTGDQLSTEWNDLAAGTDVNDASIRAKFLTGLDEKLDKVTQGFETTDGRLWAEKQANSMKVHLQEKTAADMSTRSAQAIKNNQVTLMNTVTNTVFNDPSSMEYNLDFYATAVKQLTLNASHLSPATRAQVEGHLLQEGQKNIAQSAARGLAHLDPDAAIKDLASGKYDKYVSGEEKDQLLKYAQVQKRSLQSDQDRARVEAKRQREEASDDRMGAYLQDLYSLDPKVRGGITYNRVVNDAALTPKDREHLLHTMDTRDKRLSDGRSVADDAETVSTLSKGLFSEDKPTTLDDLIKAYRDGLVSDRTFGHLRQNILDIKKEPATPELKAAMDAVESQMTYAHPAVGKDPKGKASYSQFMINFLPKYQAMQRAGTLPPNALDLGDPKSLISQTMNDYKRSSARTLTDRLEEMEQMSKDLAASRGLGSGLLAPRTPGGAPVKPPTKPSDDRPAGVPPSLGNIQGIEYNAERKQWRDPATNRRYDLQGNFVGK